MTALVFIVWGSLVIGERDYCGDFGAILSGGEGNFTGILMSRIHNIHILRIGNWYTNYCNLVCLRRDQCQR